MFNNILAYSDVSQTFSDVSKTEYYWAYDAISALKTQHILYGYHDGSYGPQNSMVRAEIAALISRIDPTHLKFVKYCCG